MPMNPALVPFKDQIDLAYQMVPLMDAGYALSQTLGPALEKASEQSTTLVTERLDSLWRSSLGMGGTPLSGEVLWMAAALGVMALALAVTRAVEEF